MTDVETETDGNATVRQSFQFTLSALLGVLSLIGLCCAAISQFGYVGLIALIPIFVLIRGVRRRNWPQIVAGPSSLLVYIGMHMVIWATSDHFEQSDLKYRPRAELEQTPLSAIKEFESINGRFPKSLAELQADTNGLIPIQDWWGHPWSYECEPDGHRFVLRSFGADGKPGGEGFDMDVVFDRPIDEILEQLKSKRVPLRKFVVEAHRQPENIMVAIIASGGVGALIGLFVSAISDIRKNLFSHSQSQA